MGVMGVRWQSQQFTRNNYRYLGSCVCVSQLNQSPNSRLTFTTVTLLVLQSRCFSRLEHMAVDIPDELALNAV